jgi:hypothetical protein
MTIVLQVWLGVATAIHANATVSAGASDDANAADNSGFASVAADAAIVRPAAPVIKRGISFDIDETGMMTPGPQPPPGMCVWALTSVDPNEQNALRVQVDGTSVTSGVTTDSVQAASTTFSESVELHYNGAGVEHSLQWQPTSQLADGFWRSGRGMLHVHHELLIPPWWGLGNGDFVLDAGHITLGFGSWLKSSSSGWAKQGFETSAHVDLARVFTKHVDVKLMGLTDHEYGATQTRTESTETGIKANQLDIDYVHVTGRIGGHRLSAYGGISTRRPLGEYQLSSTETDKGPVAHVARFGGEYSFAVGSQRNSLLPIDGVTIAAGRWSRVSPQGLAVDAGYLATVAAVRSIGSVNLQLDGQVGRAKRILLADDAMATAAIAPLGTQFWLGRGNLSAQLPLGHDLSLQAQAWAEHTDRDDAKYAARTDGTMRWSAGAQVALGWHR